MPNKPLKFVKISGLGKRHHISFSTLKGESYTVEIYDSDFSGTSTEIEGRYMGFHMDWESLEAGDNADMFAPVMASSMRFDMLIESSGMDALVTDIIQSREKRFHLAMYRNSSLYWLGFIVADEIRISDKDYPYNLSLFAIDGLSRLKEIDYKNPSTGLKYTGRQTALQHFYNIIEILDLTSVVTMPTEHFKTNFNWYSDSMSTGSGNNGLTQMDIDHDNYQETDSEGNQTFWDCFSVLKSLCQGLGGRFYMAAGHWWFMQSAEYTDSTQTIWTFNSAGTQTGYNTGTSFERSIDYSSRQKVTGGSWSSLRAMQKVIVDYHHKSTNNRAEGVLFTYSNNGTLTELPGVVNVSASGESKVVMKFDMSVKNENFDFASQGYNVYPPHRYRFKATIKMGSYYLRRNITGNIFGLVEAQPAWVIGTQYVYFYGPLMTEVNDGQEMFFSTGLTSPNLPTAVDGENIEFTMVLDGMYDVNGNDIKPVQTFPASEYDWSNINNNIHVENEGTGNSPSLDIQRVEVEDSTDGNTGIYKVDTYFGDGPFNFSISRLTDSGSNTENWAVGATTGTVSISELLANEILKLRQQAARTYQGTYLAQDIHPYSRITDLNNAYIPTRIQYSAYEDKWGGDFVKVEEGTFTTVSSGPFNPGLGNNGGPGPIVAGGPSPDVDIPFTNTPADTDNLIANANNNIAQTTTAAGIADATTDPTVNINAVAFSFVKQGDQVSLINPADGTAHDFTVASTPAPNATTLSLTGTASGNIPAGAYIQIKPLSQQKPFSYIDWNVTGTTVTVPTATGTIPGVSLFGEDEVRRRVKVWRGGIRIFYDSTQTYQNSFTTNEQNIIMKQKARGETVYIEVVT